MKRFIPAIVALGLVAWASAGLTSKTPAAAIAPDQPAPAKVTIDNFSFKPNQLTVAVGTSVTWVNHDDVPHTATSHDNPATFDSKTLDTDQSYSFTFTKPGVYNYYCKVHNHMTGTITVK